MPHHLRPFNPSLPDMSLDAGWKGGPSPTLRKSLDRRVEEPVFKNLRTGRGAYNKSFDVPPPQEPKPLPLPTTLLGESSIPKVPPPEIFVREGLGEKVRESSSLKAFSGQLSEVPYTRICAWVPRWNNRSYPHPSPLRVKWEGAPLPTECQGTAS